MNGKDAIVSDIIEKAEKSAEAIVADARKSHDSTIDKLKSDLEKKRESAIKTAREKADDVIRRRRTLANLEARKTELAAKQRVIDAAFDEATKKMLNMTDHIYREFIAEIVERFAEDGDRIIIAERDKKRLHNEWLCSLNEKLNLNLAFADETHSGKGGIILVGKKCDKNLTFETMLAAARETSLSGVVRRVFKGH